MFALFYSLYLAMFRGTWTLFTLFDINTVLKDTFNALGTFFTSIFGEFQVTNLGDVLLTGINGIFPYQALIAFILALITSIGVVVMAVKGIKRVFSVFFMGVR